MKDEEVVISQILGFGRLLGQIRDCSVGGGMWREKDADTRV
jgi:hypothetical protein